MVFVSAAQAQVLQPPDKFDAQIVPIYESRVFMVRSSGQERALQLLGRKDFCAATPAMIKELFPQEQMNTNRMLEAQAAAAIQYAEKREKEAALPFFHESRDWMLEHAKAHRKFADYTRKLGASLRPYLVKAQVYVDEKGSFHVVLEDRTLSVIYAALGSFPPPLKPIALLVWLERKINAIHASVGMDE